MNGDVNKHRRKGLLMAVVKSSAKQVRYVLGAMTAVFFSTCAGS